MVKGQTKTVKRPPGTGGHVAPLQSADERGERTAQSFLTAVIRDEGTESVKCHVRHEDEGGPTGTEVVELPFAKLLARAKNDKRADFTDDDIRAQLVAHLGHDVEDDR